MQCLLQFVVSFMTLLFAVRAADGSDGALCDFMAVIDVANEYYPGCRDLYNVLEQSVSVNYTSTLCDDSDCMAAINKLRDMDLGDCIVFGSTRLTSDILDQCKEQKQKSTAWVGWLMLAVTLLVFIPVVVYRVKYNRKKKAEAQLDLANGKLEINDAPYKVIDLAGTRV